MILHQTSKTGGIYPSPYPLGRGFEPLLGTLCTPILWDFWDFNVILGMDWLLTYQTSIDSFRKIATFSPPYQSSFQLIGTKELFPPIILAL